MSSVNDVSRNGMSIFGRATNVPLPWTRYSRPSDDQVLDGLPGRHPRQAVPGGEFALGRHRRVDRQFVLDEVEQDLP